VQWALQAESQVERVNGGLEDSEVSNLNYHQLNIDQEEGMKRLLVDVIQTFG